MAITIQKSPPSRNWSGNPIHYRLYSAAAAGDATIYFEIKIKFKRTDAAAYSDIVTLPYFPVNGTAKIDIETILDGLLEYELPQLPTTPEPLNPLFSRTMTGLFYIAYREITTATPDPAWTDVVPATPPMVIKGGISFEKWRGDNYWTNYFDEDNPFLTWQLNGRLASMTERMYLAWLNTTDVSMGVLKMRRKVVYTDGTTAQVDYQLPAQNNEVVFFPTGATQLQLDTLYPDKTILYWELTVINNDTAEALSETYRYNLDNRYDKNDTTFNFRNSLGGLDSVRVRGVIEDTAERSFTEQDSIVQHDYHEAHFILPKIKAADSKELLVSKADIGFVTKEEQDRLREIHFKRECWWAQQRKWLPIAIKTQSGKLRSTADDMWSLPIEYALAHDGDNYYTPRSIDLAEPPAPPPVCTAVISDLTANGNSVDGWLVSWNLVSGAPVRYNVSTPGVSGGAPTFVTATNHTYTWLPAGSNVITVQPVCLIGGEYFLGAAQTVTIENGTVCEPVQIANVNLPDAVVGVPYAIAIELTGTEPFVLSEVVKPSWMTVQIIDEFVHLTGTPDVATAGTTVSFKVSNCGGAFVTYSKQLKVNNPGTGTIEITNIVPLSQIILLYPDFSTLTDVQVNSNQTANGTHVGTVDPIEVNVTASSSCVLRLLRNGILQEQITVNVSGPVVFEAIPIGVNDDIAIVLSES